jgi:D-psicose/D-tagatose/L-ribulose 3-epimerase
LRISISNIAWDIEEDVAVAALLKRHAVDAIDIAPGKYFPRPAQASDGDIARVRQWWLDQGVEITGMQSLLFGTTSLNLFGPLSVQTAMLDHLDAVCRIGAGVGATRLVFGSPKNRDRGQLSDRQTLDQALSFFGRLGQVAAKNGVTVCLEPNPAAYGCNFMLNSQDTAAMVRGVDHPAIRMHFDSGAITMNQEELGQAIATNCPLFGHFHASEPHLLPLGEGSTDHATMGQHLAKLGPQTIIAIEMLTAKDGQRLKRIDSALEIATRCYREGSL